MAYHRASPATVGRGERRLFDLILTYYDFLSVRLWWILPLFILDFGPAEWESPRYINNLLEAISYEGNVAHRGSWGGISRANIDCNCSPR